MALAEAGALNQGSQEISGSGTSFRFGDEWHHRLVTLPWRTGNLLSSLMRKTITLKTGQTMIKYSCLVHGAASQGKSEGVVSTNILL